MIGADREKIYVIPPGVDASLRPRDPAVQGELRARLGLPTRYILFVGGLTPLKNLENLLRALSCLPTGEDVGLVLAGFRRWSYRGAFELARDLGLEGRLHEVGFVAAEDLSGLYSAAECLVLPSWYEGFGMPIIEAMACGCPVVTSTGGSCPEVAGGAALLAAPGSPESIAHAIARVLEEPDVRRECIKKGVRRAKEFDWQRTGEGVRALLRSLCR